MELCSNVFFGGVVNDKRQPDVCICLAKLAELSALFLAARRNFTKFCDVISWIFPRGVLYRDSPLPAGKRLKLNYCVGRFAVSLLEEISCKNNILGFSY